MVFIYLIAFIVLCITIFSIVELSLQHKRELEKIKRSDYICQKCKEKTPAVINADHSYVLKGGK